jgi:hypothetical protein
LCTRKRLSLSLSLLSPLATSVLLRWRLGALAADAARELDVLGHDGDALKGGPDKRSRGGLTLSIFEVT